MKFLQLAVFAGGVAAALQPHAALPADDVTTSVYVTTSTYTVTECATDAVNCPASATVVQTSTTVVSVTTTICAVSSDLQPPVIGTLPTSPASSTSGGVSVSPSIIPPTPSESVSLPVVTSPSGPIVSVPRTIVTESDATEVSAPSQSSAPPTEGPVIITVSDATSASFPVPGSSSVYASPTGPVTQTLSDATSVSFGVGTSTGTVVPPQNSALPTQEPSGTGPTASSVPATSSDNDAVSSSRLSSVPIPRPSQPSGTGFVPSSTATDSAPTSVPSPSGSVPANSSSGYALPPGVSSTALPTSFPFPTFPSTISLINGTSTTRITTYLTTTKTSFITGRPSSRRSTDDDAAPTFHPSTVSAMPSGSGTGYPWPSTNGTVVLPKPTASELPENIGTIVGAGKSSLAALLVALVFAHFA